TSPSLGQRVSCQSEYGQAQLETDHRNLMPLRHGVSSFALWEGQNVIFAATCPFRWPLALVILPNVVGLESDVGFPNLVRLSALNASNRMSRLMRSEILVFLISPRSSFRKAGPNNPGIKVFEVPKTPAGSAKAAGFSHRSVAGSNRPFQVPINCWPGT